MAPKLKEKTCRETTTFIIPVVTDKTFKAVPQASDGTQMNITMPDAALGPVSFLLAVPSCLSVPHLKGGELWAGGNKVLPFCSIINTYRFLFVFKHFSGFFIAAFLFYAFPLEVPRNNLFQPVGVGSPLPLQNRARLFVLNEHCNWDRNKGWSSWHGLPGLCSPRKQALSKCATPTVPCPETFQDCYCGPELSLLPNLRAI